MRKFGASIYLEFSIGPFYLSQTIYILERGESQLQIIMSLGPKDDFNFMTIILMGIKVVTIIKMMKHQIVCF